MRRVRSFYFCSIRKRVSTRTLMDVRLQYVEQDVILREFLFNMNYNKSVFTLIYCGLSIMKEVYNSREEFHEKSILKKLKRCWERCKVTLRIELNVKII